MFHGYSWGTQFSKYKRDRGVGNGKKNYSGAVSSREKKQQERQEEEERKKFLQNAEEKMERVKGEIDGIGETVPEINNIRSEFYIIKNTIADELKGRVEVLKDEGDAIIGKIPTQINKLIGKMNDTVKIIKNKKKEATKELYDEFLGYLTELETEGLMSDGKFSLQDTVAYQKLVDKDDFTKPVEGTRYEKNPLKEHIEFGYGIGNFFNSIGRAWQTRKEPEMIRRTYINLEKYINENINPIQADIDKYVNELQEDYKNDIKYLKEETKKKVNSVKKLIEEKNSEISRIETEAFRYAANEKQYGIQIEKLENVKEYLNLLISKLTYTQV